MIKKWEFIYAPCEKDARRYKIRIDGEEKDLSNLTKKIGKDCGKSFIPISKVFKWVFYIYNVDKSEKERIENILKEICPVAFEEKINKDKVEEPSNTEGAPSLEFILENIVSYDKRDTTSKVEAEEIKKEEKKQKEPEEVEEAEEAEEIKKEEKKQKEPEEIKKEEKKQKEPEEVEEAEEAEEIKKEEKKQKEPEEKLQIEKTDELREGIGTSERSAEIMDILKEKEKEMLEVDEKSDKNGEIEFSLEEKSLAEEILQKKDVEKAIHSQKGQEENDDEEKTFGELKLNPEYTFDSFVVGPNSRFTHAASLAVAENPGKIYNPLFIYGGVGLGKTHLLHAIGHFAQKRNKNLKILYITAEKFIEDVIDAIRQGTVRKFRSRCRKFDILLVDDIQFLAEAESTQEEFFHTFNILYDAQKQIVITSDKPPKRLIDVEERLKSRFEWGLTADIKSPNLETRVAILKKKEENQNIKLDDDILLYIAGRLKSNIRELEGFLKRIDAYVQLTKEKITLDAIKTLLGELLPEEKIISEGITLEIKEEKPEKKKEPEKEKETEKSEKLIKDKEAEKKRAEEFLEKEVFGFEDKKSEPEKVAEEKFEQKPIEKVALVEEIYPTEKPVMKEVTEDGKTFKVVEVGYFYPDEHEEDLKKIKKEFESVIEKHKLKFRLKAVFEKAYTPYEKVEYKFFVDLCKKAGIKIVIVLGPPKGKELKEAEFSTALKAFLDDAKISLQFVPFGDMGKQFRFLNLVLDIVLVSHKK